MKLTDEQSTILDAVRSSRKNLMLRARAGCGKTSTLELIDKDGTGPYLLICFNKAIATEAQKKMRPSTMVRTFNSIGHKIWADHCKKRLSLDKQKILNIYRAIVEEAHKSERAELWSIYDSVTSAVNMARAIGYIPDTHAKSNKRLVDFKQLERHLDETLVEDARGLVDRILNASITQAYNGVVDFNDQVYMPSLFGGQYPTFPVVLIDEYQDLSPVNRAMVAKLCRKSRQIGVGDESQAIYEFRGADARAMPDAIEQFGMEVLPLSTSFRCPTNITDNVHWLVPDITSFNPGGIVESSNAIDIELGSAVICRYNAPLLSMAMRLLAEGLRVDVAGIDIGARVIKLLQKLGPEDMTQGQAISAVSEWLAEKESMDSKSAPDMAACMKVFILRGKTLGTAIAYAKHIFESTGEIKFMSGHKAKGLEFDHVYHLNADLIGSTGQDPNIYYVIDTRPRARLTYIEDQKDGTL